MILELTITASLILVVILGYTTFNLLRKLEKSEDIIVSQEEFVSKVKEIIELSDKRLLEIDQKGTFKSDDEIGWFFGEIKEIQNILSQIKED